VHDELVFDAHKDEVEIIKPIIYDKMTHAIKTNVPIEAEMGTGFKLVRGALEPFFYFHASIFYMNQLLDIGDFIGVKGETFITKTGETTIRVKELTLLSKALRPLPVVKVKDGETFDAFADVELRYRQRYVDLIVNPEVRATFMKRSKMIQTIRDFLNEHGALWK
jgi:hypothetical protein